MLPKGSFDGGQLFLPPFGLLLNFQPGDLVLFYSNVAEHVILGFNGEQA